MDMQIITYTGKPVSFGTSPKVSIKTGENLGYKKIGNLHHFVKVDGKTIKLKEDIAARLLANTSLSQNVNDILTHLRSFAIQRLRLLLLTFQHRWRLDDKAGRGWQQVNNKLFWYNLPMRMVSQDEYNVIVRFVFTDKNMRLLLLFPRGVSNPRYQVGQPIVRDLLELFRQYVLQINQRFNQKLSVKGFDFQLPADLRLYIPEVEMLPAVITTSEFRWKSLT